MLTRSAQIPIQIAIFILLSDDSDRRQYFSAKMFIILGREICSKGSNFLFMPAKKLTE